MGVREYSLPASQKYCSPFVNIVMVYEMLLDTSEALSPNIVMQASEVAGIEKYEGRGTYGGADGRIWRLVYVDLYSSDRLFPEWGLVSDIV